MNKNRRLRHRETITAVLLAVVFTVTATPVFVACAASGPREEDLSRRAKAALRLSVLRLGLQTEFPNASRSSKIFPARNFSISPTVATYILYGSGFVIAAAVFMALRSGSFDRSLRASSIPEEPLSASVAERMEKIRIEADELARSGNFAEAIHALLLQSLAELRRYLQTPLSSSLTSREILRHVSLPSEGRSVFADIVERVEISYFGAYRPGEEDYSVCRQSFDVLTRTLRQKSFL